MAGNVGSDILYGGDGNDTLVAGIGNSYDNPDPFFDIYASYSGNNYLDGGNGNDTLKGGVGNDTLFGRNGNDNLVAGIFEDTGPGYVSDNSGNNYLMVGLATIR
ncbi:hypothetical protein [Gloeocapsopsis dulcis]|uniref:calcium-binding protein n=1 Tax=Gloeocapsopsis dulcis TaxID=2859516 RepID=UPI002B2580F2|nr:hypothetical protein [Gloeocapsopsis dulcis]WNN91954.1 hypothetical protein P0S91_11815 [Gloeocapsopsis dulcis]